MSIPIKQGCEFPVVQPVAAEEIEEIDPIVDRERIRVLPGSTDTAASFQIDGEDHTLGNALRYVIMKNPDVEFCGYSIPHPSEAKLNIRIQTYDNVSVYKVLDKGLQDLMDLCDVVEEKFVAAKNQFDNNKVEIVINPGKEHEERWWEPKTA